VSVRPRVYQRYEQVIRLHLLPELGAVRLVNLTPEMIQAFYAAKRGTLAPNSVRRIHEVLHNALHVARARWHLISYNPCDDATPGAVPSPEHHTLSPQQATLFLDAIQGDPLECLCTLALTTALRQGELLGLKWADVDLERGVLRVRRQVQRMKGRGIQELQPKSQTSRRTVVLPRLAIEALLRQQERIRDQQAVADEDWKPNNLVHPSAVGTPMETSSIWRHWKRLLARTGFPDMRFHDLRHTTANLLLAQGVPIKAVSEILGHSSIGITADTYGGTVERIHHEAMRSLDALLAPQSSISPQAPQRRLRALPKADNPAKGNGPAVEAEPSR
jgi:integrase